MHVYRHRIGSAARVSLGGSYDAPRALLPPAVATDRSLFNGGVRVPGGPYALVVAQSVASRNAFIFQIHEVDRANGHSCVRYSQQVPNGERQPGHSDSWACLNGGYVWWTPLTRLLYDVMYLRDGASVPANLTQCGSREQSRGAGGRGVVYDGRRETRTQQSCGRSLSTISARVPGGFQRDRTR